MKKIFMALCMVAFAIVGCGDDESWSPSARANDEPGVESSSSGVTPQSSDSETSVSTGTMTDSRDGQTYRTVKIGTQTWMAENLNYAYTGVPYNYSGNTSDSTSWCYKNEPENCAKYGRLYTWAAAMDSVGTWTVLYAAFAPRAGTYRTPRNGIRCSRRWAVYPQPVRLSSPLAAGMNMKAKAATVRILSGSRRCLPAAGTAMGITATRATTRTSGVLRRTVATTRTTCTWATATTTRACTAALCTTGVLFVVSRTGLNSP